LAVPAVQIVATGRLFGQGLLVKSGDALERLADVDTVVLDKTGTLTEGRLTLVDDAQIEPSVLQDAARLARASQHPLARALASAAGMGTVAREVREVAGEGLEVCEQGRISRLGNARWCGAKSEGAGGELWFRSGQGAPVCFLFEDRLRPSAPALVMALRQAGCRVEMLTGDAPATAARTAWEAGIAIWRAGVKPDEKVAHLEALRAEGHKVLMVGDGLNDAAAMALAHASIAPGTAADVSQMASDMVLQAADLMPIAEALQVARKAHRLVLQNFALSALYNVLAVPLAALGLVTPLLAAATMSSSSLLVSLNALRLAGKGRP
jgi:Cu2+-exporting ATPase